MFKSTRLKIFIICALMTMLNATFVNGFDTGNSFIDSVIVSFNPNDTVAILDHGIRYFKTEQISESVILQLEEHSVENFDIYKYSDQVDPFDDFTLTYWLSFTIDSTSNVDELYLYHKNLDIGNLYLSSDSGLILVDKDGRLQNRYKPIRHSRFSIYTLHTSNTKPQTYILELKSLRYMNRSKRNFRLTNKQGLIDILTFNMNRNHSSVLSTSLIIPYMFGLSLFFLVQYFSFARRQRILLYYSAYLITLALYYLRNTELNGHLTYFLGYIPLLPLYSEAFLFWISTLFYTIFIYNFIEKEAITPLFRKVCRLLVFIFIFFMVLDIVLKFFSVQYSYLIYEICRPISYIIVGWIMYLIYKIKSPLSKYAFVASTFLVAFTTLALFVKFTRGYEWSGIIYELSKGESPFASTVFIAQIGVLLETIVFSLGLAYRNKMQAVERSQFRLQSLIKQLNNHSLNNGFNTAQGFIHNKEYEKAITYLQEYGHFFRNSLNYSRLDMIPLSEEIKICKGFLEAYKLTNKSFDFSINCSKEIDLEEIPFLPMLSFPFLENSIKHGFDSQQSNAKIEINIQENKNSIVFTISDNGSKMKYERNPESLGLDIIKERINEYQYLYHKKISFKALPLAEERGFCVKINIEI